MTFSAFRSRFPEVSGYCHCADSQGRELAETGRPTSGHATGREGRSPSPYLQSSSSSAHLLPASLWGARRRAWSANVTRAPLSTAAAGPRGALRPLGRGPSPLGGCSSELGKWDTGGFQGPVTQQSSPVLGGTCTPSLQPDFGSRSRLLPTPCVTMPVEALGPPHLLKWHAQGSCPG